MISPLDYRYFSPGNPRTGAAEEYLSYDAFVRYCLKVESALAKSLSDLGVCSGAIAQEISAACARVSHDDVRSAETVSGHEIRALVTCIKRLVGPEAAPFVHLFATSSDIVDSANAMRVRDYVGK